MINHSNGQKGNKIVNWNAEDALDAQYDAWLNATDDDDDDAFTDGEINDYEDINYYEN